MEPSDTNVVEYSTAEIACATTGNPAPTVTSWMKDGVHLRFDGSKSILTSGTLRISYVSRADAGYYQCVAKNRVASVISKRAKLNVACKLVHSVFFFCHIALEKNYKICLFKFKSLG